MRRSTAAGSSYDALLPLDVPVNVEMEFAPVLGLNGKLMSRIIFGTLFLSKADDPCALLDAVRQTGCNAYDCAAVYGGGECERLMGLWLLERKIPRDKVVLITKGGCHGQEKLWSADLDERLAAAEHEVAAERGGERLGLVEQVERHRVEVLLPQLPLSPARERSETTEPRERAAATGHSS